MCLSRESVVQLSVVTGFPFLEIRVEVEERDDAGKVIPSTDAVSVLRLLANDTPSRFPSHKSLARQRNQ